MNPASNRAKPPRCQVPRQCGVCDRWTEEGSQAPSGNRNPRTGETPCENFICRRCQSEAGDLTLVGRALDQHAKHRAA